ncbi:nicotinate phosphoribosyltransferase [uncultured Muribaculum sp.]|uniref:nicotinate phosphoribosyltransferase n=1 Tax=uncultured Muribaculum sp. TaxID=1918613 RepID=UPI0025B7A076|nr:nicotinate phosphoribosyltransferase [uncultured Muribaculum sp.]
MQQIIRHFTDDDLYKFTMCCAVIENYPRTQVRYRFIDRGGTVYPDGFANELRRQIEMLENLQITADEILFMRKKCRYIPAWFYDFLKGFRYDSSLVTISQDSSGKLDIVFEGSWCHTILLEVKVLAIVSELYYMMTGQHRCFDYDAYYEKSWYNAERLINAGCVFSDFGTRRRASFAAQDTVVRAMSECQKAMPCSAGRFVGTSNVYLAMKYGMTPVGTMAHEFVCAIAGMYGPQMSNHIAMEKWRSTYRGALGTFLYDTYGWRIFSLNFSEDYANMFKGLRVDSGDNFKELDRIVDKYKSLGIDPCTKQVVFSNALNVDRALEIQRYAKGRCIPSFGIGTHFTNDFSGVMPLNIVIKLVDVKITESWPFYCHTCKLSEDKGKYTGLPDVVDCFMKILHLYDSDK